MLRQDLTSYLQQLAERNSTVSEDRYNEEKLKEKEVREKEMVIRWIPKKYLTSISDKYLDSFINKNLFIFGPTGTGKTTLACHIARESVKVMPIQYYSFPSLIMQLQSSFRDENVDPFKMAKEIARFHGLLVLDDIGAEKLTDYVKQIIYYLINEREQWDLRTVITSNFSLAQLDTLIDQRIASRIAGMCEVLSLTGKDMRLNSK